MDRATEIVAGEGISARVLSIPTVKPLDAEANRRRRAGDGRHRDGRRGDIHRKSWGAVAETVVQHRPNRVAILGVPEFAPTGSAGFLLDRYGMSPRRHRPVSPGACSTADRIRVLSLSKDRALALRQAQDSQSDRNPSTTWLNTAGFSRNGKCELATSVGKMCSPASGI
jgi:hypothetical protein